MKKYVPWIVSAVILVVVALIWWSLMEYVLGVLALIALLAIAIFLFAGITMLMNFLGRATVEFIETFVSDSEWVKTIFGFLLIPTFSYLATKLLGLFHNDVLTVIGTIVVTVFFFCGYIKME